MELKSEGKINIFSAIKDEEVFLPIDAHWESAKSTEEK